MWVLTFFPSSSSPLLLFLGAGVGLVLSPFEVTGAISEPPLLYIQIITCGLSSYHSKLCTMWVFTDSPERTKKQKCLQCSQTIRLPLYILVYWLFTEERADSSCISVVGNLPTTAG